MLDLEKELGAAVAHFWQARERQKERQGAKTGRKDAGERSSVTAGKHADGFVRLVAAIVEDAGLPNVSIHVSMKRSRTLPGFYRPSKEWDLVVLSGKSLVAVVEVKSQVGSLGNNFNNRIEEALGNATDFWAAYREGIFRPSERPWLGYLFMLEESDDSLRATRTIRLEPFKVDEAFQRRSYAKRYELACERLVRDRLYDAACLITSNAILGMQGIFNQPSDELSIRAFAVSLHARAAAFAKISPGLKPLDTSDKG